MPGVSEPDAVGNDLVEAKAQVGGPATEGVQKLRVKKRLPAGEAEQPDAVGVRIPQKTQGGFDIEPVRPLDGHAAMRTSKVALVRARKGQVIGPKRPRPPFDRLPRTASGVPRSEERRVGKECRCRWSADQEKRKR